MRKNARRARARPAGPRAGTRSRRPGAWPARGCAWSSRSSCRARGSRGRCPRSRAWPGSRLAVGSSRNSTSGRSAHARASASRCCSPPESTRAGGPRWRARPTRRALRERASRFGAAHAGHRERVADVGGAERRSITGALEDHRLARGRAASCAPQRIVPRSARGGRAACAAACSCPRRWGPARRCACRARA